MKISILCRQLGLCLAVITLLSSVYAQRVPAQDYYYSEAYADSTRQLVKDAISSGKTNDIRRAEANLCGMGWLALYGKGDRSRYLAQRLNRAVTDAYKGTERMPIYIEHTSAYYREIFKLKEVTTNKPVATVSPAYMTLTRQRVDKALGKGADQSEFRLAEGSLCALGWLILYRNDPKSLGDPEELMSKAARAWPRKGGIYMQQSSEAYAEIMNLGRFTDNN